VKAAVVLFPGSNREIDMVNALAAATGREPAVVWHGDRELPAADLIVIPGGFSYGDYLRAGAMAAHSPIMRAVAERAKQGQPVLGVCNGFQILTEAGLLPGALMRNATLKFACKDVYVRVENSQTLFTGGCEAGRPLRFPIAHADGNYFADDATLDRLEARGQIAFRYCSAEGDVTADGNPNGSARNIAGVFNETKTVLGLMPHPENAVDPLLGSVDGQGLFKGLIEALS
jgi:phosphoribosylformylglycinamidine synthase